MDEPRWRRRKTARPAEIIEAAFAVFAENGFAAAKLDAIARRAGISKGTLYLYFETKEELFRAVVRTSIAPDFASVSTAATAFPGPFAELAPMLLARAAWLIGERRLAAVVKMVVGESRNFPDLARIWHDEIVSPILGLLAEIIARAQARGEIRAGDPSLHAFTLFGPIFMAALFREVFAGIAPDAPDLEALAAQHAQTALLGLLVPNTEGHPSPSKRSRR